MDTIEKEAIKEENETRKNKVYKFLNNRLLYRLNNDISLIIVLGLYFRLMIFDLSKYYNTTLLTIVSIVFIINLYVILRIIARINIYKSFIYTINYIQIILIIIYPIVFTYRKIYKIFNKNKAMDSKQYTEEDIKFMLDSTNTKEVELEEKEMIHSIFNFSDTTVKEIMTPRTSIVALSKDDKLDDRVWEEIIESGFSRIPIYNESIDDIVGVLNVKELFKHRNENKDIKLERLMKPVLYVPESKLLMEMLEYFRKEQQHMAIIIDEYGGTLGLITIEDLLEEIVGEIRDEYDIEEESFKQISINVYEILGDTLVEEINDKLNLDLELSEEYDTISGYIQDKLERVANINDKIIVNNKYIIQVLSVDNKRINKIKLVIKE